MREEAETCSKTRPLRSRWPRCFLQFSLRTLLIVTTLAGVACWWFLRPHTRDAELIHGQLKLRRQVRSTERASSLEKMTFVPMKPWQGMAGGFSDLINVGIWQLWSGQNDLLVDGHFENNHPHGAWTIYHCNGQMAAHGTMSNGAKDGVWYTWDDEGRPISELAYAAVKSRRRIGGGGRPPGNLDCFVSQRHGTARAWHSNGVIKLQGEYSNDLRHGLWTLYDEQGHVTAAGAYRTGKREGPWTLRDDDGTSREVQYVGGSVQENR